MSAPPPRKSRTPVRLTLLGFAWLMGTAACGGGSGVGDAAPAEDADTGPPISDAVVRGSFRGFAVYDVDGRPRFEPCGPIAASSLLLVDSAGGDLRAAYQEIVGEPGGRLFVEVRGYVEPVDRGVLPTGPDRRLVAEDVRRAALSPEGCDESLDGLVYRASGNEPFWALDVTSLDMTLERPGSPSITFPFSAPQDSAGMTVYTTRASGGPELRLVLDEERCYDSMSGFWYSYSATAIVGQDTLTGCAAQGW